MPHRWVPACFAAVLLASSPLAAQTAVGPVTVGAGISYPTLSGARAVVLVGAERRVSPRIKLLTENYLSAGNAVLTGGLRVVGRKRTLDLAWFKFPGAAVYPLPLIRMTFQVSGR